ncbi:MAG TPA: hypothetical protein VM802_06520 [Chitinophaga sp.]|uniref:hypothetical protein n=1 Tax=Chitinophaga sp. TaxID=1869181 RepID=UPI002B78F962|nr:hypothetical protein [Chitinophaga sp.]HVI44502.1 hypothetical protein [Chitinophaga sp.]
MTTEIIIASIAGGALPDVIRIIKTKDQPAPVYFASPYFWVGLVLQIALGVFASWLLNSTSVKEAVLTGYTAPNIITTLVANYEKTQKTGDKGITSGAKTAFDKLLTFWRN